ncbi:MAG: hypothetical protein AAF533_15920 [Acidobacteriota bacterium]
MRFLLVTSLLLLLTSPLPAQAQSCTLDLDPEACPNVVTADVVALDQVITVNRAGSQMAGGMTYALRSDVVSTDDGDDSLQPGEVTLRSDKRPRPIVLRVNEGDCLRIDFQNLLAKFLSPSQLVATRNAGVHVKGMSLVAACAEDESCVEAGQQDCPLTPVEAIQADGSFVGANVSSLAAPGERRTYVLKAEQEGGYLLTSTAANFGLIYGSGQITAGLHGAVHVEPPGATYLRSQVTREQLHAASKKCPDEPDGICRSELGHPILDYDARDENGQPILKMVDEQGNTVHTDLTAIIAYQNDDGTVGDFPYLPDNPLCFSVPAAVQDEDPSARCTQPFREITTIYFEPLAAVTQAFPCVTSTTSLNAQPATVDSSIGTTTITTPPSSDDDGSETYDVTVFYPGGTESDCPNEYGITPWLGDAFSAQTALDSFGINYGVDGLGARLLSNRLRVGPQADCIGCKFEEFFLTSWANGDPAQISSMPNNVQPIGGGSGAAADAQVYYPDDPSNVYHSYIRDHVKYRIHNAGSAAPHVHHQHAHQWLHAPNADESHYLDSQTITVGTSYTLEMVYDGSGNRNETVGDSIFHCHFYPHFAAGMWSLWRVHDVFEEGTELDDDGRPLSSWACPDDDDDDCRLDQPVRALPDGEMTRGTPIPALVPLPGRPMAPMPAAVALTPDGKRALTLVEQEDGSWESLGNDEPLDPDEARDIGNPGYPFFVASVAGQRPARPPLDVASMSVPDEDEPVLLDGGLPRHVMDGVPTVAAQADPPTGCTPEDPDNTYRECHTRFDFSKILLKTDALQLAEEGEAAERLAMLWHGGLYSGGRVPTCTPDGKCDGVFFRLNGAPPCSGAPFADPCTEEDGWTGGTRHYKAAAIQADVVFNKDGWHYPQQRLLSLWEDVEPTLDGERAPEPLFFRANSGECVEFWHANLIPSVYALDDFQVRTPTDVIGQHIHLVKFDVTSSDGAANGYNYEDATLSPDEVRERIDAINAQGGLIMPAGATCPDGSDPVDGRCRLRAKTIPFFGEGPRGEWLGAMATIQRWMADPLVDDFGDDRTLRSVFTHDHLSPSTHQQTGLYAGLLIEPACSQWVDSWTGEPMGGSQDPMDADDCDPWSARPFDGGPTSWRSNVVYRDGDELTGMREFALEYQAVAHMYPASTTMFPDPLGLDAICPSCPGPNIGAGIGNSHLANKFTTSVGFPTPANAPPASAPNGPWPQAVSFGAMYGGYNINYRNEPMPLRVTGADGSPPPAAGVVPENRDYGHVYRSIERELDQLNVQPDWYPPLTGGVEPFDPYTPLLEAYAGDPIQLRLLVGAHFNVHPFTIRGLPWLSEPSLANSGYRATQATSISEHFEINVKLPDRLGTDVVDYLYETSAAGMHQNKGAWGLLRAYQTERDFLAPLPGTPHFEADERTQRPRGRRARAERRRARREANREARRRQDDVTEPQTCSSESLAGEDGFTTQRYTVFAIAAESFVDGTPLPYDSFASITTFDTSDSNQPIETYETAVEAPNGLVYVHAEDVEQTTNGWKLKDGLVFEPLVLRAAAGDCIEVTLVNHLDPKAAAFVTDNPTAKIRQNPMTAPEECNDTTYRELLAQVESGTDLDALDGFAEACAGGYRASSDVGLHAQLVALDQASSAGYDAGRNATQTAGPGEQVTHQWYAGHVIDENGRRRWQPVEFGSANLLSSDPLYHHTKGLFGGLVIEPQGSSWITDANTRLTATVHEADGSSFREGVLMFNDDVELYFQDADGDYQPVNIVSLPGASGQVAAVNYGIEYPALRSAPPGTPEITLNPNPSTTSFYGTLWFPIGLPDLVNQTCWLSSTQEGRDPATTLLTAHAGDRMRIRLLHPQGDFTPQTFVLHGHGWQQQPYEPVDDLPPGSGGFAGPGPVPQVLGANPTSQWRGATGSLGSTCHSDVVLEPVGDGQGGTRHNGAGGSQAVPGDYLYRTFMGNGFGGGAWGLFRVGPAVEPDEKRDILAVLQALSQGDGTVTVTGSATSILGSTPDEPRFTSEIALFTATDGTCTDQQLGTVSLDAPTGPVASWTWTGTVDSSIEEVCAVSVQGRGRATAPVLDEIPCPGLSGLSLGGQQ